jgi:hypothetical protein
MYVKHCGGKIMTLQTLSQLTCEAGTHLAVVGDYSGQYTLGVSDHPTRLVLRVAATDTKSFPRRVMLDGEAVPVEVTGDLAPIVPVKRNYE